MPLKKGFSIDRIKVLALGLIIGLTIGICGGFLWGTATITDMIRIEMKAIPQQMTAIPF